jgi:site-specific DNA recombinase
MVEVFERHNVAFASVSEAFNTNTPMGRMTLHVLLAFSQMEREVTSERTKDKVRAARRRGQWTGGCLALGFDLAPGGKKLAINETEAFIVRELYRLYGEHESLIEVARIANANGWVTKRTPTNDGRLRGGVAWSKSSVHRVLTSPAYVARQIVEGEAFPCDHPSIVDLSTWEETQARLEANGGEHTHGERHHGNALLAGLLKCPECGSAMSPSFCRKGPRVYRYYRCSKQVKMGAKACRAKQVNAEKIESEYVARIAKHATDPRVIEAVVEATRQGLAERKKALADESRALSRAIKDAERDRAAIDDPAGVVRMDGRIAEHRSRLDTLQAERAAVDGVGVDPEQIAGLLRDDFDSVWQRMTSGERRHVIISVLT